jgi:hypothetical protein
MNLILLGGACLGAVFLGVEGRELVKAATIPPSAAQIAAATAEDVEQPGFMTHDFSVDPETGETTEISVIGFVD